MRLCGQFAQGHFGVLFGVALRSEGCIAKAWTPVFSLRTIATDKLKRIEIPIVGLDCKACSLAAYEIVARLKGVEQAQASFKEGRVTVLVDAEKIDQAEIEAALKQRGVTIKPRE